VRQFIRELYLAHETKEENQSLKERNAREEEIKAIDFFFCGPFL